MCIRDRPNAVDVGQFAGVASSRDFRAELHALGKVLVVSVGRLEPEKGALQFAQAAPLLGDGFVLALAGEGSPVSYTHLDVYKRQPLPYLQRPWAHPRCVSRRRTKEGAHGLHRHFGWPAGLSLIHI